MLEKMIKYFEKYKEVLMYLIFGVLTTLISLLVYYVLTSTVLNVEKIFELQFANVISWIIGVLVAYITNRKYVFESENKSKIKEFCSFVSSRVTTLVMDMVIMFVGVSLLMVNDKLVKLISQTIVIISNYFFSKLFVFKVKKI